MRRFFGAALTCAVLCGAASPTPARTPIVKYRYRTAPERVTLPSELQIQPASSAADTFVLASFDFEDLLGPEGDPQGWVPVDLTAQVDTFWHVAGTTELDGGSFGRLVPLEGLKSMWCGQDQTSDPTFCGWATPPGYGNDWEQSLISKTFHCDSIRLCYKAGWDTEPEFDTTLVEYLNAGTGTWTGLPVNGGNGSYDAIGTAIECLMFPVPGDSTRIRFRFVSDGAFSDEDGQRNTDGAFLLDSMTVECYQGGVLTTTFFEDFEDEVPGTKITNDGCWQSDVAPGYGSFADLYPGSGVIQQDPCVFNASAFWGWFADPVTANYDCGGFPQQGAVPFVNPDGLYMHNEIWSPRIPFTGSGNEVLFDFLIYRDLPVDNLIGYIWAIRSWIGNCPGGWTNDTFVDFGGQKDWFRLSLSVATHVAPGAAQLQLAIGTVDTCPFWCGVFGTGACHSHAPLIDDVTLKRVAVQGPRFGVRHLDLFQDNFADDGTTTGTARADCANDIALSNNPEIVTGDSITFSIGSPDVDPGDPPLKLDPFTGVGPAAYVLVAVLPQGQPGKSAVEIEAPEMREIGTRYPAVDSLVHDGITWYRYRADTCITTGGFPLPTRFCFDLDDAVFTPGDTILYALCATNINDETAYFSRRLNGQGDDFTTSSLSEALSSPMEFMILPGGGVLRGGDILYVDDVDDRGGPVQNYFDTAFDMLGIRELVDRYDVLAPSSHVGNGLGSRVKSTVLQLIGPYRNIIWSSGSLGTGLIGDGTGNPEKSDDFEVLFDFMSLHSGDPGLYLTGDNIAEEWATLLGANAINLKSIFMNFNLIDGDHVAQGEPLSPCLVASGACFVHNEIPDSLIALGGCPFVNDFDVIQPTGDAETEFLYPNGSGSAVISQATSNGAATARIILSGFSYHYIRDNAVNFPPARVEHLEDILTWLQNLVGPPTGLDPAPQFVNRLDHNYPNPFNPVTTIHYSISEKGPVSLRVYNVAGQLVRTLVDDVQSPREGGYSVRWDGRNNAGIDVSSGVYFYRLTATGFAHTRKMVMLK